MVNNVLNFEYIYKDVEELLEDFRTIITTQYFEDIKSSEFRSSSTLELTDNLNNNIVINFNIFDLEPEDGGLLIEWYKN